MNNEENKEVNLTEANAEAKQDIIEKTEQLEEVIKQGEIVEEETQGKNPNYKEVKDMFVGEAPVDKINKSETKKETESQDAPKEVKSEPQEIKAEKSLDEDKKPGTYHTYRI